MTIPTVFWLVPIASVTSLCMAWYFFRQMMKEEEGNDSPNLWTPSSDLGMVNITLCSRQPKRGSAGITLCSCQPKWGSAGITLCSHQPKWGSAGITLCLRQPKWGNAGITLCLRQPKQGTAGITLCLCQPKRRLSANGYKLRASFAVFPAMFPQS